VLPRGRGCQGWAEDLEQKLRWWYLPEEERKGQGRKGGSGSWDCSASLTWVLSFSSLGLSFSFCLVRLVKIIAKLCCRSDGLSKKALPFTAQTCNISSWIRFLWQKSCNIPPRICFLGKHNFAKRIPESHFSNADRITCTPFPVSDFEF
jgi:hypothetical protein